MVLETWYNQRALLFVRLISEPTHHPLQCTQAVTALRYLKIFFFSFKLSIHIDFNRSWMLNLLIHF